MHNATTQIHSDLSVEFELYAQSAELWALSKVLEHSPTYKKALWEMLETEHKEALKLYALARQGKPHGQVQE